MKKIVLIGAGSAMFTRGLVRDLIEDKRKTNVVLVDAALKRSENGSCPTTKK